VAVLVTFLSIAPGLQGHASTTHPDHFTVQLQPVHTDTQRIDCCIDGESSEHTLNAECSACVLPCMSALLALLPGPTISTYFAATSHLLPVGQVMGGLAAVPDLRPPKTRS